MSSDTKNAYLSLVSDLGSWADRLGVVAGAEPVVCGGDGDNPTFRIAGAVVYRSGSRVVVHKRDEVGREVALILRPTSKGAELVRMVPIWHDAELVVEQDLVSAAGSGAQRCAA